MYSSRVAKMAGLEFDSQGGHEGRGGVGVDSASGTAFHGGSVERVYLPGSSGHQGRAGVLGEAPNAFDSWEAFIESLPREWKTLNVVSAVLTSCVSFCSFPPPLSSTTELKNNVGPLWHYCKSLKHLTTPLRGALRCFRLYAL
jgi:hypothetical protein